MTTTPPPEPASAAPDNTHDVPDAPDAPVAAGATRPLNSRSAYLPVLPDGWEYEVMLRGPGNSHVMIEPQGEAFAIRYSTPNEPVRGATAPNFRAAAKVAAKGAKVMDRVHRAEQEASKARDEALGVLGSEQATS